MLFKGDGVVGRIYRSVNHPFLPRNLLAVWVGLAGMRERTRELGGQLSIERCAPGTAIFVTMPLPERAEGTTAAAAD